MSSQSCSADRLFFPDLSQAETDAEAEDRKRKREEEEEPAAPPQPPKPPRIPRPVLPPQPHAIEHAHGWTPFDVPVNRGRRSVSRTKPTRHLDVLLSCSDGDMPDFRRHRGTAMVFRDDVRRTRVAAPQQTKEQQAAALAARLEQQAAKQAAEQARAMQAAKSRSHGYSTRVRNATKNFKVGSCDTYWVILISV